MITEWENKMNATQESIFYRRQDFDEVNRQQVRMAAFWQLSDEDLAAEERHWNLVHGVADAGNKQ